MALKFYKVINGLKSLFKSSNRASFDDPIGNATFDSLSQAAVDAGVTKDSIVITQATEGDTKEFGGKFLPGTNVMLANGQTFIDATNIVQGVYTKILKDQFVFCAPYGTFLATDEVRFARVFQSTNSNGIIMPVSDTLPQNSTYIHYSLKLVMPVENAGGSIPHDGDTPCDTGYYKVQPTAADGTTIAINDYLAGLQLTPLKDVAFCVYRANNQITNWFQWTIGDYGKLNRSKGLYLPGIKEIKYQNLVDLVNAAKLVPGRYYKIIDYYPTTKDGYNMTDGAYPLEDRGYLNTDRTDETAKDEVMVSPRWQIIVQALTKDWLNEDALAFNGGYDGNYHVCRIKYSLLGNATKYPWANSTSTGVIYYMEDQNGNSANYDFKNLKFTGVKQADVSVLSNSAKIGQVYNKDSSVVLTKDLTGSHWTFESLGGVDLSSTPLCTNCHIETPTPQRVVLISTKMDSCCVLSTSSNSTIYGKSVLNHVVLDRAQNCYATVYESSETQGIEHVNILGSNHILICQDNLVYSNITNSDTTILSASEIKNVNTNGYYGGPLTLLGTSFQHINFVDYCAQIRILGVNVGGTTAAPTYSLGGYILYGQFNSARSIVLKTKGKHFTNFTFMPGDYKANFITPSNAGIGDQGSYTFIGGNYNTNETPKETNGSWNTEIALTRANKINNLYAPSASKFTLL